MPREGQEPFQTTQGNRLSCRDQEGRRGSDEVVPGPSMFPSREPGVSGNSWGSHEGCQEQYPTSGRSMGLPLRRRSGLGTHLVPPSSSCGGILELRRGFQASSCVGPGKPNLPFELQGKAGGCPRVTAGPKRPHLGVCPGPHIPLQGRQGPRGCIADSPGESGLISRGSKGLHSPPESRRGSLGAP